MLYHRLSVYFFLAVAHLACLATPVASPWDDVSVKHAWEAVPDNWESLGPPHPGTTMNLFVALKSRNENALIDALYEVSTPGNPNYGAHLTKEEVAELVAPHPDTLELVYSWLAHHGVQSSSISTTHGGNWLTLSGVPVSQANELLGASYQIYQHSGSNDTAILRTVGYALPTVLHAHVKTVAPTTFFASIRTPQQTSQMLSVGEAEALAKAAPREPLTALPRRDYPEEVVPEFLRWLYGTISYIPEVPTQNAIGIVGYKDQLPLLPDLTSFMSALRSDAISATYHITLVDAVPTWNTMNSLALEANLETQYAQAMAFPTKLIYYATSHNQLKWDLRDLFIDSGDAFLIWIDYLFRQDSIPQTIITLTGVLEEDVPPQYAWSLCALLANLGARGVSIISSSGDDGVGPTNCTNRFGSVLFMPRFPATCPFVTSVGGTTSSFPEVAAYLSGGGFSRYFPRPDYQNVSVPKFLDRLGSYYSGWYNPGGRGVPDMAAQALNFVTVFRDTTQHTNSTNCAATTVGGVISLINDHLIFRKKPPLGFLNPWLYGKGAEGLNDIIWGHNPGCGTGGFSAVPGWDPATGLGTPDFSRLVMSIFLDETGQDNQGRTFPELLNTSDASVPTRDANETPRK